MQVDSLRADPDQLTANKVYCTMHCLGSPWLKQCKKMPSMQQHFNVLSHKCGHVVQLGLHADAVL